MMKSTAGAADCGGIALAVSSPKKDDAHKRTRRGHKGVLQLHHLPLVPGCAKCPNKFVNLKHLILTVDVLARDHECTSGVLRLACLLELSPVLKHLELHLACLIRTGEMLSPIEELPPAREPHYRLKTLHMTGVYGYNNLFVLALHYARTAMALDHMVIDPEAKKRYVSTRDAVEEDAVHQGRRMANEHLRGRGLDGILTIL